MGAGSRAAACGVAVAVLAATAGAARAASCWSRPASRQGYYLSAAFLAGASHTWEDDDSLGTWRGSSFNLRLGQLLTPRFGLGLQIRLRRRPPTAPRLASTFGLGLETHYELVRNLAAHASIGLGVLQLTDDRDPDAGLRGTVGAEYVLGLSYAWYPFSGRPSGGFSVTPTAQTRFIPGDSATGLTILLGVELAWWTGLPRNQLQPPRVGSVQEVGARACAPDPVDKTDRTCRDPKAASRVLPNGCRRGPDCRKFACAMPASPACLRLRSGPERRTCRESDGSETSRYGRTCGFLPFGPRQGSEGNGGPRFRAEREAPLTCTDAIGRRPEFRYRVTATGVPSHLPMFPFASAVADPPRP